MISFHNKKRLSILLIIAFLVTAVEFPYQINATEMISDNAIVSENETVSEENASETVDDPEEISEEFVAEESFFNEDISGILTADSTSVNGISLNSLSSNFTKPYAFLTKKKVVLNGMRASVSDDTYLVMNTDGDYEVTGIASSNNIGIYIDKVSFNELPAFRIGIEAGSKTTKGTYKYDISLKDRKSGAQLNKLKFKVVIKKTNPPTKWKKQTVVLGTASKNFALNSPNVDGVSIVPINSTKYKAKIPDGIYIKLQNESTIKITADTKKLKQNKNYAVQLYFMYTDSPNLKVVKKRFKVKITNESPSVTFKKTGGGTMDLAARAGTSMHFRPVVKNTGMVVNDVRIDGAISENYIIEKDYDPETREITDIYIKAKDSAVLSKGKTVLNLDAVLQDPRMDTKEVHAKSSVKTARKSSKIRLAFVSGNQLKFNETLSDNLIAGTIELRVLSPLFAKIDTDSILDLTYDKGKVPKDAFKSYWTVDEYGQAARIRVVADKSKIVSGKKYTLTYSLRAKGADKNIAPTKVNIKVKIS